MEERITFDGSIDGAIKSFRNWLEMKNLDEKDFTIDKIEYPTSFASLEQALFRDRAIGMVTFTEIDRS